MNIGAKITDYFTTAQAELKKVVWPTKKDTFRFSLAVISILETHRQVSGLFTALFIPVLILSVPIFDTLFVSILRKLQGRSVFEGGKDHTSHHLVAIGLSQRKTVVLLYAISIIFGLSIFKWSKYPSGYKQVNISAIDNAIYVRIKSDIKLEGKNCFSWLPSA